MSKSGFYLVELLISVLLLSFFALLVARYYRWTVENYVEAREVIRACDTLQQYVEMPPVQNDELASTPMTRTLLHVHDIFVGESNRNLKIAFDDLELLSLKLSWSTGCGATRTHEVVVVRERT